jgi:hypothetical protein
MVRQLIDRGCPAERIAGILDRRNFRGADGEITDPDQISEAIQAAYPEFRFNPDRWFLDQPFHQGGQTWVLTKRWGMGTEPMLEALSSEFPEAGVGYRRADAD